MDKFIQGERVGLEIPLMRVLWLIILFVTLPLARAQVIEEVVSSVVSEAVIALDGSSEELINLFTDQTPISQNTLIFRLPSPKIIYVNWGDGNIDTLNGIGGDMSATSVYTSTGNYRIKVTGDVPDLTSIDISSQSNISGNVSSWSKLTNLELIYCNNTSVYGDVSGWSALTNLIHLYCQTTSVSGNVSGWSALTKLEKMYCFSTLVTGDVSGWSAWTDIEYLYCQECPGLYGDVSGWSALTKLIRMHAHYTDVSGDISGWSSWTNVEYLYIQGSNVTGDISGWSALTKIKYLFIEESALTGSINGWSTMTSLLRLYMSSSLLTGDVSNLAGITTLLRFYCDFTSITGDLNFLSNKTGMIYVGINTSSVTYTTSALPAWNGIDMDLRNCSWTETMVDDFLIDLADGCGATGTVQLGGTNSARSSASDAAINTLTVVNSWTVTTN